jgi:hypothetical protein
MTSPSVAIAAPTARNTRWLVVALLTVGVIIAYTDRINLFVIPTEVEGSAVFITSHPDRSGGICSSLNQHPIRMEALPSPLSSRPKWRDLQFS